MPDKISILKESGETISSNVVSVFMIPDTEKKYIITTENAVDPHGLTVLHVSEIVDGNLQKIATDEEWSSIKTIMRAMISGNVSSYQYLPTVESINANGQYSRDISVSASASKQMIDNYLVGEKSNVVTSPQADATAGQADTQNPPQGNPAVNQTAIFPAGNGAAVNSDDELIPGISEVNPAPVDPSVLQNGQQPMVDNQNLNTINPVVTPGMDNMMGQPVTPMGVPNNGVMDPMNQAAAIGQVPGMPPIQPMQPMQPSVMGMPNGLQNQMQAVQPVIGAAPLENGPAMGMVPPVTPGVPDNNLMNGMNNDVQVPVIPGMPPLTDSVNTTTALNEQVNNNLIQPTPVLVNTDAEQGIVPEPSPLIPGIPSMMPDASANPEVQVLQPSVVVPTAQIAQEAQESVPVPEVKIDANATPSFAPDASLDEVVVAAQEMFMEGVKNLVQTIQEKVYRDLYARENAVKEKETLLEQREKMLNEQMMAMMSNFAAMQGKTMPTMSNTGSTENK